MGEDIYVTSIWVQLLCWKMPPMQLWAAVSCDSMDSTAMKIWGMEKKGCKIKMAQGNGWFSHALWSLVTSENWSDKNISTSHFLVWVRKADVCIGASLWTHKDSPIHNLDMKLYNCTRPAVAEMATVNITLWFYIILP